MNIKAIVMGLCIIGTMAFMAPAFVESSLTLMGIASLIFLLGKNDNEWTGYGR